MPRQRATGTNEGETNDPVEVEAAGTTLTHGKIGETAAGSVAGRIRAKRASSSMR